LSIWTDLLEVPFRVEWVEAGGVATRSLRAGSGDPVIFLHGTTGHLEAFVRNIPAFAAGFDCHAIDMLGHGWSGKPDYPYRIERYLEHLEAYLDAAGIERAHIVGESLGGWTAARFASRRRDRLRRLILVAPGGLAANPNVMERIKRTTTEAVESTDIALTRERVELLMHDPARDASDELVQLRYEIYHQPGFRQALPNLLCLQEMDNRQQDLLTDEELRAIEVETLIVWGQHNPFGEIPDAERLHAAIPNSRLTIYPQCGHWPQHEVAEQFNRDALAFLSKN
jgi:2-hydroxy-6-oxonona-2,4-dienedioate hydrolase